MCGLQLRPVMVDRDAFGQCPGNCRLTGTLLESRRIPQVRRLHMQRLRRASVSFPVQSVANDATVCFIQFSPGSH